MENILTPEDKQVLQIISKYLRANGLKEGTIEVDMDYGEFRPEAVENYDFFSNSYNVEIPKEFIEIVKKVLVDLDENGAIETPDVDDINYERLSISLDAITRQFTIEHYYSYYEPSEEDVTSWSEKDYEDEEENTITQLFNSIKEENPDIKPKNGILTVRYNGSGDSGYMEDYFEEGGSVPSNVEDWCYDDYYQSNSHSRVLHGGNWVQDALHFYYQSNSSRVLRGGNWVQDASRLRSTNRSSCGIDTRSYTHGFRVAAYL